MKWYSVKSYLLPLINNWVFLTDGILIYTGYLDVCAGGKRTWYNRETDDEITGITHFCLPGPVEIED